MPTLPSRWQLTSRQDESWSRAAATERFSNAISSNHLHGDHGSFASLFAAARSRWGSKARSQEHQLTCHQMCVGFQARLRFQCCSTCKVGTVSGYAFRVRGIAASFMCLGDKCVWVGLERSSKRGWCGLCCWERLIEHCQESRAQTMSELGVCVAGGGNWGQQETVRAPGCCTAKMVWIYLISKCIYSLCEILRCLVWIVSQGGFRGACKLEICWLPKGWLHTGQLEPERSTWDHNSFPLLPRDLEIPGSVPLTRLLRKPSFVP